MADRAPSRRDLFRIAGTAGAAGGLVTGSVRVTAADAESIDLDAVHSEGYSFQIEMTYRALCLGFRVAEVPIIFVDRRVGQSKMSRRIFVEALLMVWRLRLKGLDRA